MGSQTHRRFLAEIHRDAERVDAERRARMKAEMAYAREHRTPKTPPVMPTVRVGDRVRLVSGAVVTVVKVNRKSVVTEGGVRWAAGEFEVTA